MAFVHEKSQWVSDDEISDGFQKFNGGQVGLFNNPMKIGYDISVRSILKKLDILWCFRCTFREASASSARCASTSS